jgi:hypothetical protein
LRCCSLEVCEAWRYSRGPVGLALFRDQACYL